VGLRLPCWAAVDESELEARKNHLIQKTLIAALAILALIGSSSNVLADDGPPLVIRAVSGHGPPLVSLSAEQRGPLVPRDLSKDAGLIKISDNLTPYPNSPYWGWFGYASFGPQGGVPGTEQWLATAFTPTANHLATRVEVPAEYYNGTNAADLSLYDDAGGVPGKALHTWHLTNLPNSVCCTLVGGSYKSGIALSGGTQYWVVLSISPKDPATAVIWVLSESAQVQEHGSSWAVYCSGGGCSQLGYTDNAWNIIPPQAYGFAFSVLGK